MKKRALLPVQADTQADFLKRMTANPTGFLNPAPGPETADAFLSSISKLKGSRNSAAVQIPIAQEDKLPPDYAENKEPYDNIAFSVFKQQPAAISTFVESEG